MISCGVRVTTRTTGTISPMKQSLAHIALVVQDYDEAIDFYTQTLNFDLIEDTYQPCLLYTSPSPRDS